MRLLCAGILVFGLGVGVSAQSTSTATPTPRFDTVSIRPSTRTVFQAMRERLPMGARLHPGRLTISHLSIAEMIQFAYGLDLLKDRVVGPDWLDSYETMSKPGGVFDVDGSFPVNTSEQTIRRMLQTLLAERFKLRVRLETPSAPAHLLVVARGGPTFAREESVATPLPEVNDNWLLGLRPVRAGVSLFEARTIGTLAAHLTLKLGVLVVDRTDLQGRYDIRFEVPDIQGAIGSPAFEASRDAQRAAYRAAVNALGLALVEDRQVPSKRVIIEYVERMPIPQGVAR